MDLIAHCFFFYSTSGAEVYSAPIRTTVRKSSKAAASAGFNQREAGSNSVGISAQLNR